MTRRKNPLDPKQKPPRAVYSYGRTSTWKYRGREITIAPTSRGGYKADWVEPTEEGTTSRAYAEDEQGLLANVRHKIDVAERGQDFWAAETLVHHVIDAMHDYTSEPISRSNVARAIEVVRRGPTLGRYRRAWTTPGDPAPSGSVPVHDTDFAAFDALPLKERLRLIDEVIDYQARADLIAPERYAPTPMAARNPKKKNAKAKKNPGSRAAALRKMMRL